MSKLLVQDLIERIYEENSSHFDYEDSMGGDDCDCYLHTTIKTIVSYWEKENA